MSDFSLEELKNIALLINAANIKGADALTVALLQQKIAGLIKEAEPLETKEEKSHGTN